MSSAQGRAYACQVMPAMAHRVILNDELRGDGRAETEREGCCLLQLVIRERAYSVGCLTAVPAQKFKRGCFRYFCLILCMFGIYLGDNLPCNVRNGLAAGDCSRSLNLNGVHAGDVMHYDADRATISGRYWCAPFRFRESFKKGRQEGSAFLYSIGQ